MAIAASLVKELREKSGAGIMDAKHALTENNGDIQKAIDWLRVKGIAKAAGKSGRATREGMIGILLANGAGVAVEVNSETDFVARNAEFCKLVRRITEKALKQDNVEALLESSLDDGTVQEAVTEKIAKLGENLTVRRMQKVSGESISCYIHNSVGEGVGKIGVLVAFRGVAGETGEEIAMHVAAATPVSLSEDNVPEEIVERERQILVQKAGGKPPAVIEKIVAGGLKKFYSESTLLNQKFVMDTDKTVARVAEEAGIVVLDFIRFEVGENL